MADRTGWADVARIAVSPFRFRMPDRVGMIAAGLTFMALSVRDPDDALFFNAGMCLAALGALLVVTGLGKKS